MKGSDDKCSCVDKHPLVLQYNLGEIVVSCSKCNLNSTFIIPQGLNEQAQKWKAKYTIQYQRWLNEDDFDELEKTSSEVNQKGLRLTKELLSYHPFYYWWHSDSIKHHGKCPGCGNQMAFKNDLYSDGHFTCDDCRILINE